MGSADCLALVQEATKNLGLRQYHEAITLATKAIRLEPRHAPAYVVRAVAFRKLNKLDRALADLTLAIRLEPDRPSPYVIRADIFKKRCELDRAIDDATQAIFLDPNSAAAFEIRAACRKALGDEEGAGEDSGEVLRIDPTRLPLAKENSSLPSGAEHTRKDAIRTSPDAYRDVFADGKPVDRSLNVRKPVGDDAEKLAELSDYRPETLARPLARGRAKRTDPGRSPWRLAMVFTALVAIIGGGVLVRWGSNPEVQAPVHEAAVSRLDSTQSGRASRATEAAVPIPAGLPPANWISLMPSIDPARDSFGGRWGVVEGGLISPDGGSLVNIPYRTPAEYKLRLRVMKGSEQMIGIGLVTGRTQHLITIDSYPTQGCHCKFDVVDGKGIIFHQGQRVLPMHEVSTVICTVRKGSIAVECNGLELGRWEGDFGRLSVHPAWAYGPKSGFFIASVGKGSVVKGLDLLPLTRGADPDDRQRPTPADADPSPTFLATLPRIELRHNNGWWSQDGELALGGLSGNPMARKPFMFEGHHSRHGIYLHASSAGERFITYRLDRKFAVFQSEVVVPEMFPHQDDPRTPIVLKVQGDGRTLWESRPLARKGDHQPCSVSVTGINELSLRVECRGADNWGLAAWVEPRLFASRLDINGSFDGDLRSKVPVPGRD